MATVEQRQALMAVTCSWCGAGVDEPCHVRKAATIDTAGGRRRPQLLAITTLDGGSHDARWQKALGVGAPVVQAAVAERTDRELVDAGQETRPW